MNWSRPGYIFIVLLSVHFLLSCRQGERPAPERDNAPPGSAATEEFDRGIPVEALVLSRKILSQQVSLTGVLKPLHAADIVAEVTGKVEAIYKRLGSYVSTTDTLAVIEDTIPLSQFRQAQAHVLTAENNLKIARLNLESDEKLYRNEDISRLAYENSMLTVKSAEALHLSEVAQLSLMEKNYLDTRITSPFKGKISRIHIDLGTMVTPNMPLYRVVDLRILKIKVGIPQFLISRVNVGDATNVTVPALNNPTFSGVVRYLSPEADENTGTFTTEIHIKNTGTLNLQAGMTAKIEIMATDQDERLAVPAHAVISKNGSAYIYKITGDSAKLTEISITETFGENVALQSGVAAGDTVVVVGMKNLGVETRVWIETLY